MKIKTILPFNFSTVQRVKTFAFTLAETLIVIGIIGVVAALTLPNLNHATGDKEKVTKVKKIYSALTDAVDRAQVIYGDYDTWYKDILDDVPACNERFAKRVTEFMKVSKDCGTSAGCFSAAPLLYSFEAQVLEDNYFETLQGYHVYMVTLSDGMSIGFQANGFRKNDVTHFSKIRVDIDGPNKGKNQMGNDIFDFSIYTDENFAKNHGASSNQLYPSSAPGYYEVLINNYETAWVIENGNLDYLKTIRGEDGHNCPNGKTLDWTTNTSCN